MGVVRTQTSVNICIHERVYRTGVQVQSELPNIRMICSEYMHMYTFAYIYVQVYMYACACTFVCVSLLLCAGLTRTALKACDSWMRNVRIRYAIVTVGERDMPALQCTMMVALFLCVCAI